MAEFQTEITIIAADLPEVKARIDELEKRVSDLTAMLQELTDAGIKSCLADDAISGVVVHKARWVLAGHEYQPTPKFN